MTDENNGTRKPHNHFNELSPEQLEEWAKIDAAVAETKRIQEIGEAQKIFDLDKLVRIKVIYGKSNQQQLGKGYALGPIRTRTTRTKIRPQIHYSILGKPKVRPILQRPTIKRFR